MWWHGRQKIVVTHGCRKTKKLICGTEGEIVVAHGRLPFPAPVACVLRLVTFNQSSAKFSY